MTLSLVWCLKSSKRWLGRKTCSGLHSPPTHCKISTACLRRYCANFGQLEIFTFFNFVTNHVDVKSLYRRLIYLSCSPTVSKTFLIFVKNYSAFEPAWMFFNAVLYIMYLLCYGVFSASYILIIHFTKLRSPQCLNK